MPERILSYRNLRRILSRFGIQEDKKRGKGSHRMLVGVVSGQIVRYPVKCHNESQEFPRSWVASVRKAFKLTPEDGVDDRSFYDG